MGMKRSPFTSTRLEEERAKDKYRQITLKLNEEEAKLLEHIKDTLDTPVDATAIKLPWKLGWQVLQRELGDDALRWLSRRDRERLNIPKEGRGS
jgi:hypothetical protein